MKLYELLGKNKPINGDFGVEIEVEGAELVEVNDKYWNSVHDGSLRGESFEYVFKKPLIQKDSDKALESLKESLKNSTLKFSFRTSVHVHVNVQELEYKQLLNMIYTYLLIEEPLMTFCGKERKGNRFCLRLQDAEGILDTLIPMFRVMDYIGGIREDAIRYSAINLAALQKFGSLEFRAMQGNLDVKRISTWTKALFNLREFSKSIENPRNVLEIFNNNKPEDFLKLVLKDVAPTFIYPKLDRDMRQSFSLSIDLPSNFSNSIKEKQPGIINSNKVAPAFQDIDIGFMEDIIAHGDRPQLNGAIAPRQMPPPAPRAPIPRKPVRNIDFI